MTQVELKKEVLYNGETGLFSLLNGKPVGWIDAKGTRGGYVKLAMVGKQYLAHRLAWLYVHGVMPDTIDHINGNRADNRLANLRVATLSENARNRKIPKNNSSGVKGINFRKDSQKWQVRIVDNNGVRISLGTYSTLDLAIKARQEAEDKYNYSNRVV